MFNCSIHYKGSSFLFPNMGRIVIDWITRKVESEMEIRLVCSKFIKGCSYMHYL